MDLSSSSTRAPIPSIRAIIESDISWKRSCICCNRFWTKPVNSCVPWFALASMDGGAPAGLDIAPLHSRSEVWSVVYALNNHSSSQPHVYVVQIILVFFFFLKKKRT
uniref:Uncharacterized protein n=1 Tax=Trypanosoma vivax (strain Y486) TaxID=1055687 RepID=G0U3G6_TRYVY|nr:hypothetical protein, unlikely [Trypanosoma vivax Y486]